MRKTMDVSCTESILYKCDVSNTGSIVGASNMETAYCMAGIAYSLALAGYTAHC